MEPPPPPPPPHGSSSRSGPKSGGLPDGKYDIFVIPPSSAGSGFLYLPSLQTQRNSFLAGVLCTAAVFIVYQAAVPVVKEWVYMTVNGGGSSAFLLVLGVAAISWIVGKTQGESTQFRKSESKSRPEADSSYSRSRSHSHTRPTSHEYAEPPPRSAPPPRPPTPPPPPPPPQPEPQQAPPQPPPPQPQNDPPPQASPPPKSKWQRPQPSARASTDAKSSWEKAKEETRKREEEKRRAEEIKRRRDELEKDRLRQREKEARERLERELKEKRDRELRELTAKRERDDKERKDREEKEKSDQDTRARLEKLEREKQEREAREEREAKDKEIREAKEREERLKKELEDAKAKAAAAAATASATSAKKPPIPTAATERDDDAYSFRPYDRQKRSAKTNSAGSIYSEDSYAPSATTAKTTPPASTRGPYSTKDPDKIIIKAVYSFSNAFLRTPIAQLVSGQGQVTDGLILRITTEGLFIDDDVRGVPQREWDIKAWTMKLAESCEINGMHVLRASIRDQEGKRYVFIISQAEGWKVAIGLQRLRRGTQVRAMGVAGMPPNEAKALLENLGWT